MSYEEEDTCMSYEEEDTCMSYEEEDTCMSYEEEDTCQSWKDLSSQTLLETPGDEKRQGVCVYVYVAGCVCICVCGLLLTQRQVPAPRLTKCRISQKKNCMQVWLRRCRTFPLAVAPRLSSSRAW
jgi:hypothetical protein